MTYKIFRLEREFDHDYGGYSIVRKEPIQHSLGRLFATEEEADEAISQSGTIGVQYEVVPIRQV